MTISVPDISVKVDGKELKSWASISMTISLDNVESAFALGYAPGRSPLEEDSFPFPPHTTCQIYESGEQLLSGYLGDAEISEDQNSHTIVIPGHSLTKNLVECSNVSDPLTSRNNTATTIIEKICKPYSIRVSEVGAGSWKTDKVKLFKGQRGETAFDAINRVCGVAGIHAWTVDGETLLIGRPGQGAPEGDFDDMARVVSKSITGNSSELYSDYIVVGRAARDLAAKNLGSSYVTVTDPTVSIYRALILRASGGSDVTSMKRQAQHEMNIRRGNSRMALFKIDQWRRADGKLWRPGTVVRVSDSTLFLHEDMVISSVTYSLSASEQSCLLEMKRPEVYDPERKPKGTKSGGKIEW